MKLPFVGACFKLCFLFLGALWSVGGAAKTTATTAPPHPLISMLADDPDPQPSTRTSTLSTDCRCVGDGLRAGCWRPAVADVTDFVAGSTLDESWQDTLCNDYLQNMLSPTLRGGGVVQKSCPFSGLDFSPTFRRTGTDSCGKDV